MATETGDDAAAGREDTWALVDINVMCRDGFARPNTHAPPRSTITRPITATAAVSSVVGLCRGRSPVAKGCGRNTAS